jgi:hypothetical protein
LKGDRPVTTTHSLARLRSSQVEAGSLNAQQADEKRYGASNTSWCSPKENMNTARERIPAVFSRATRAASTWSNPVLWSLWQKGGFGCHKFFTPAWAVRKIRDETKGDQRCERRAFQEGSITASTAGDSSRLASPSKSAVPFEPSFYWTGKIRALQVFFAAPLGFSVPT